MALFLASSLKLVRSSGLILLDTTCSPVFWLQEGADPRLKLQSWIENLASVALSNPLLAANPSCVRYALLTFRYS